MVKAIRRILCLGVLCCSPVATFAALPAGWAQCDVGNVPMAPDPSTESGGVFTIQGSSPDSGIWGKEDQFHFVYRQYTGDFTFIARVNQFDNAGPNAMAGLMLRDASDPCGASNSGLRHASVFEHGPFSGPVFQVHTQMRPWNGHKSFIFSSYDVSNPNQLLKLVRYKDQVSAWRKDPAAAEWTFVGGMTLRDLTSSVVVGFAVGSASPSGVITAKFDTVSLNAMSWPYKTSWAGNTLAGGYSAVQQSGLGMYVHSVPGTTRIMLNSIWDERFKEASLFDADGKFYWMLDAHGSNRLGGSAITTDGTYIYQVIQQGDLGTPPDTWSYPPVGTIWYGLRRYTLDGISAPYPPDEGYLPDHSMLLISASPTNQDRSIHGVAYNATNQRLYISDTYLNRVLVYHPATQEWFTEIDAPKPRDVAVDVNGNIWVIAGDALTGNMILHLSPSGTELHRITTVAVADPTGIAVDSNNVLWVTDNGPDQQVKKFNSSATQIGTFGVQGGIYASNVSDPNVEGKGVVKPLKFNGPMGVGFDLDGNVYVLSSPSTGTYGGTELRKFNSAQVHQWSNYGLSFVEAMGIDPDPSTDGTHLYDAEGHYVMDYTQQPQSQWTYKGMTLDRIGYPDDMRNHMEELSGVGGVYVRRYAGQKFLFVTHQYGGVLGIYRFENDSEIAIPCGLFMAYNHGVWPYNHPGRGIWTDTVVKDGAFQTGEFVGDGPNQVLWGWWVDQNMDIWVAAESGSPAVRRYLMMGLQNGVPTYTTTNIENYSKGVEFGSPIFDIDGINCLDANGNMPYPDKITKVMRAYFDVSSKAMYLGVFTCANDDLPDHDFGLLGREIRRYDNPEPGVMASLRWTKVLPYTTMFHTPRSMTIAGDRVYAVIGDTREVLVLDALSGHQIEKMVPGPEIGGESGLLDVPTAMNAFQRSNGNYLVTIEDDLQAKGIVFQDPPLYLDTFSGASDPFTPEETSAGGLTDLYTVNGNQGVRFRDTTAGFPIAGVSIFQSNAGASTALVTRINQILAQAAPSPSVQFDLTFWLERLEASTAPGSDGITVAVIGNKVGGGTVALTGAVNPTLYGSPAYNANEASGGELLELVDYEWKPALRFTITPGGGATQFSSIDFQFRARVLGPASNTPESYVIDNLTVIEVLP